MKSLYETAEEAMMEVINTGETFTFRDLHTAGDRATKTPGFAYRPADRLLQRLRRDGVIELVGYRIWKKVKVNA